MPTTLPNIAFNRLKNTATQNQWLTAARSKYPEIWPTEVTNPKKYNRYLLEKLKNNPQRLEKYIEAIISRVRTDDNFETDVAEMATNFSQEDKTLLENCLKSQKTLNKINLELSKTESDFDPKTIQATKIILESNLDNLQNPTIITILEYIQNQLDQGKPLDLAVVNCLKRNDYEKLFALPSLFEFRETSKKVTISEDINFFDRDPVSIKGWAEIKTLLQKLEQIDIELKPTIYLGDTDFYFLIFNNFRVWAENSDFLKDKFNQQIQAVVEATQAKANKYFGENQVEIQRLSQIVDINNFDLFTTQFNQKQTLQNSTIIDDLLGIRIIDYVEVWGLKQALENSGFDKERSLELIKQEANLMIAQYAFEAKFYPGLFGFAETTKDTFFCFNSPNPFEDNTKPVFILNRRK